MNGKKPLTGAVLIAILGSHASAGFMDNKGMWDNLSIRAQETYVMGAFDTYIGLFYDDPDERAYQMDVISCTADLNINSTALLKIVNQEYSDLSSWERPPVSMLLSGLRKVCLDHMNRARAARGEPALSE